MEYIYIILFCFIASYIHSATGFGNALILMSTLPLFLPFKLAAIISVVCGCLISFVTLFLLRKFLEIKKIFFEFIIYFVASTIGVLAITYVEGVYLQKFLGASIILLVIISRVQKSISRNIKNGILFCSVGGILGGMVAMGGPIMAHYFMNSTDKKESFKTNLDFIFGVSGLYSIILHLKYGNINMSNSKYLIVAIISASIASVLGYLTFKKIKFVFIKKIVYILMFLMSTKMILT